MTLRMERVLGQLPAVVAAYAEGLRAAEAGLRAAESAIAAWGADLEAGDRAIADQMANSSEPYALSFGERTDAAFPAPPFDRATVIGVDGSSIEPDRFAPAQCYVVNTGFAVLPYGVPGAAVLDSLPRVGPRAPEGDAGEDTGEPEAGPAAWGVNLRRDVAELEKAAELAAERTPQGAVVVLLDGTLFPWDLDSPRVAEDTRRELRDRTQDALDAIHQAGSAVSPGAYISGSRARDVVTSVQALAGPGKAPWPAADAQLFSRLLGDGERSALFQARSQRLGNVERLFSPAHRVCFFYLRVASDLARVEVPHWAASRERVDRLHAALVDQCRRCDGYPRALQEAHEQAVIAMGDRLQFGRLLETEAGRHGLRAGSAGKHASKRRRAI